MQSLLEPLGGARKKRQQAGHVATTTNETRNNTLSREELHEHEEKIMQILDMLCFKGSRHLKRGSGITSLPQWIIKNAHLDFVKELEKMFKERFNQ